MLKKIVKIVVIFAITVSTLGIYSNVNAATNCSFLLVPDNTENQISSEGETRTITLKLNPNGKEISGFNFKVHSTNNITITDVKNCNEDSYEIQNNPKEKNILVSMKTDDNVVNTIKQEVEICKITINIKNTDQSLNYACLYLDFNDGYSIALEIDSDGNNSKLPSVAVNSITYKFADAVPNDEETSTDIIDGEQENKQENQQEEAKADDTQADKPISKTGEGKISLILIGMMIVCGVSFIRLRRKKI